MTNNPPILRNSLLALPVLGAGAAFSGGLTLGMQVIVAGLAAVANLALLQWLTGRATARVASGDDPGLSGMMITLKLMLTLPLFALLMQLLAPLSAVIGFTTVVVGVAVTGLSLALFDSSDPDADLGPGIGHTVMES